MKHLTKLFKILELTRSQVQYGYLLSGVPREQVSNLAEHHYLVTFIGWQLAKNLNAKGANLDVQKVLEFCLIHDLGEIMGGDISIHYAKANPKARKFAKQFEEENQKFLAKFFGDNKNSFRKMAKEILDAKSDEALVAKIADYMECGHFRVYANAWSEKDLHAGWEKAVKYAAKIKDKTAKSELKQFLPLWFKELIKRNSGTIEMLSNA